MHIKDAKHLMESLSLMEGSLRLMYKDKRLSMAEQDYLSDYHSESINQTVRESYPFIKKDIVRVYFSHKGIDLLVDMGDRP